MLPAHRLAVEREIHLILDVQQPAIRCAAVMYDEIEIFVKEPNVNRMIILHSVLALGLVGCNEQQSTSMQGQGSVDLTAINDEAMPSGPVATMWVMGMA